MTENQRLKILRQHLEMSQIAFAEAIGIKQGSYSDIERGKVGVSGAIKKNIEYLYDVDIKWLETGEGEMLTSEGKDRVQAYIDKKKKTLDQMRALIGEKEITKVAEPSVAYAPKQIPMYESAITASEVEVYSDQVQAEPAFVVSIPQFKDCSFGKVIYGQSMYPTIESGTYVFCKPVADKFFFIPGEIYYIEVDNFAICKRLRKGAEPGFALAVSDNDELLKDGSRKYQDFDINLDKVRNMWLVKGYFRQSQN